MQAKYRKRKGLFFFSKSGDKKLLIVTTFWNLLVCRFSSDSQMFDRCGYRKSSVPPSTRSPEMEQKDVKSEAQS